MQFITVLVGCFLLFFVVDDLNMRRWGYSGMVIMVKSGMFLAVKLVPKMCFVKPEIRLDMNRIWFCICVFSPKTKKPWDFPPIYIKQITGKN